jgi:hypothetical protein
LKYWVVSGVTLNTLEGGPCTLQRQLLVKLQMKIGWDDDSTGKLMVVVC